MAREFAGNFYKTKAWQQARALCVSRASGLCERCLEAGFIVPGEIVHHKVHLTPDNIGDPNVTLSQDNLQLVCRDCHAAIHAAEEGGKRYKIGADGRVHIG